MKIKNPVIHTGLAALLLSTTLANAATDYTLTPTDDLGARNIANATPLYLSQWDHAFIKFPLNSLQGDVQQATLRIYVDSTQELETHVWAAGTDDWNENSGRPANAGYPWLTTPLATQQTNAPGFIDLDVTDFIRDQASTDLIASFEVSSSLGSWQKYASRDGTNAPQLVVETSSGQPIANVAPVANIDTSPVSGKAPLTVSFDGSGSSDSDGTIASYHWNFAGDSTASGSTSSHTFNTPGEYTVTLTVTDDQGLTGTTSSNVSVSAADANLPPVAVFNASANNAVVNADITFDATDSSDPEASTLNFSWDFGDSNQGSGSNVAHSYSSAGSYAVTLTVTDPEGLSDSFSQNVTITSPTVPSGEQQTTVLHPTDDIGATNNGASSPFYVSYWDHGFLKFSLSEITDEITSATFRIYTIGTVDLVTDVRLSQQDSWNENSGHPAKSSFLWDSTPICSVPNNGVSGYVECDLTAAIKAEAAGDKIATIEISSDNGGWKSYGSKEGSFKPELVIETEVSIPVPVNESPTASFSATPVSGIAPLTVTLDGSASNDNDGSLTNYQWNFGNGSSGNGVHTTTEFTEAGIYTVSLTVTDDEGASSTASKNITVTTPAANIPPVASFTATPENGPTPLLVSFDSSASNDTDGSITTYQWDFGDGTSASTSSPSHTFSSAGVFTVTLTVTDNDGATHSSSTDITVVGPTANLPPVASFSSDQTSGTAPLIVTFDSTGSNDSDGSIVSYQWDFGDGTSSTEESPSHTYTVTDTYTVTLTVTDDDGASHSSSQDITVTEQQTNDAPSAAFTVSSDSVTTGAPITLNAMTSSDDNGIVSYNWLIGDGRSGSGVNLTVAYSLPGTYPVTLTVVDEQGATDSLSQTITVTAAVTNGGTINLNPSDDYGASRNGSDPNLYISYWDHGFFKFPLKTITGDIESAVFRLYYTQSDTPETTVWAADHDNWSESGNTPGRVGFSYMNTPLCSMTADSTPGYLECDVTDFIQQEKAGDGIASLEVSNEEGGWKNYLSKESGYAPELVITTTSQAGAPLAMMELSAASGTIPFDVNFDGSGSFDTDGSISSYQWKLNGREISSEATDSTTIAFPGTHDLSLTVTDDAGISNTITQDITADGTINIDGPIKALLITGGAFHDYIAQTTVITEGINQRLDIQWDVVNGGTSDVMRVPVYNDPDWAAGYDVIVHNECSAMVGDVSWVNKIIEGHTSRGVPAVAIHCTMHSFGVANTDEWHRFVGVTSPTHEHGLKNIELTKTTEHSITSAIDNWVTPIDELYIIDKVWPDATVLATGYGPQTNADHAVFWTNQYDNVRVFGTSLGHTIDVLSSDEWLDTVSNGILWATNQLQP